MLNFQLSHQLNSLYMERCSCVRMPQMFLDLWETRDIISNLCSRHVYEWYIYWWTFREWIEIRNLLCWKYGPSRPARRANRSSTLPNLLCSDQNTATNPQERSSSNLLTIISIRSHIYIITNKSNSTMESIFNSHYDTFQSLNPPPLDRKRTGSPGPPKKPKLAGPSGQPSTAALPKFTSVFKRNSTSSSFHWEWINPYCLPVTSSCDGN